jgi:hypothetical protein
MLTKYAIIYYYDSRKLIMTSKDALQQKLAYIEGKYGVNAPQSHGVRRQLVEIEQEQLSTTPRGVMQFHAGLRKAIQPQSNFSPLPQE